MIDVAGYIIGLGIVVWLAWGTEFSAVMAWFIGPVAVIMTGNYLFSDGSWQTAAYFWILVAGALFGGTQGQTKI